MKLWDLVFVGLGGNLEVKDLESNKLIKLKLDEDKCLSLLHKSGLSNREVDFFVVEESTLKVVVR